MLRPISKWHCFAETAATWDARLLQVSPWRARPQCGRCRQAPPRRLPAMSSHRPQCTPGASHYNDMPTFRHGPFLQLSALEAQHAGHEKLPYVTNPCTRWPSKVGVAVCRASGLARHVVARAHHPAKVASGCHSLSIVQGRDKSVLLADRVPSLHVHAGRGQHVAAVRHSAGVLLMVHRCQHSPCGGGCLRLIAPLPGGLLEL